jgi:hypothetical protein
MKIIPVLILLILLVACQPTYVQATQCATSPLPSDYVCPGV